VTYCTITEVIGRRDGISAPTTCPRVRPDRTRYTVESCNTILMQIRVLFFGVLKDLVGRSSDTLDLPEGARLQAVLSHYARQALR